MSADALAVRTNTKAGRHSTRRRRWISPPAMGFATCLALLCAGWYFPTEKYITPQRGLGYLLGICGGSMMLLLFVYSARKHFRWLAFLGPTATWFRFHLVLGLAGPVCILYHANFRLGATNSNVALLSMLTVAGSGVVGRYIYSRIHHGLYGSKASLAELRSGAEKLTAGAGSVDFLPELAHRLEEAEKQLLVAGPHLPVLSLLKPAVVGLLSLNLRWSLRRYVSGALRIAARRSTTFAAQRTRLKRTAFNYIDRRLAATRRLADFQAFERLFSVWHALHIPLIVMLLIAGFVHVIVVHLY